MDNNFMNFVRGLALAGRLRNGAAPPKISMVPCSPQVAVTSAMTVRFNVPQKGRINCLKTEITLPEHWHFSAPGKMDGWRGSLCKT